MDIIYVIEIDRHEGLPSREYFTDVGEAERVADHIRREKQCLPGAVVVVPLRRAGGPDTSMRWTKTPPATIGWYWYKNTGIRKAVVWVFADDHAEGTVLAFRSPVGIAPAKNVAQSGGWWSSRALQEPI